MLDALKKIWSDAGANVLRDDYELLVKAVESLPRELNDRVYGTMLGAYDATLQVVGTFDNVSRDGLVKLAKIARQSSQDKRDLDLAASYGMALYYMWLLSKSMDSEAGRYVFYKCNLAIRASQLTYEYEQKKASTKAFKEQFYAAFDIIKDGVSGIERWEGIGLIYGLIEIFLEKKGLQKNQENVNLLLQSIDGSTTPDIVKDMFWKPSLAGDQDGALIEQGRRLGRSEMIRFWDEMHS